MARVLPLRIRLQRRRGEEKHFLGPEKSFQVPAFQTELQARYSTMPGLERLFWRGIRLQRRRGEEGKN
jgi:hypothetical protein